MKKSTSVHISQNRRESCRRFISNMRFISLTLLIVGGASFSPLMAQSDLPVDLHVSNEPCSVTSNETSEMKTEAGDDTGDFNKIMVSAALINTGFVPLDQLSVRIYVIVSPIQYEKSVTTPSYSIAKVFTFENLALSGRETVQLHLGKVVLKYYSTTSAFGASEEKAKYEGFVARFYQDGKCIGTKGSEKLPGYTQLIEQVGNSNSNSLEKQYCTNF